MTVTQVILAYYDESLALWSDTALTQAQETVNQCLTTLENDRESEPIESGKNRQLLTEIRDFLTAAIALQLH